MTQKMKKGLFKIIPTSVVALMVLSLVVVGWQGQKVEVLHAAAPTTFTSATYQDSNNDGVIDQVVVVINGAEVLTTCDVSDAEVAIDWTYVGNDIGGSLSATGHSCVLATATITLLISGANLNTTGAVSAPTIEYADNITIGSIANASGTLGAVSAMTITDGAAPVPISATYHDETYLVPGAVDGTISEVWVDWSENISVNENEAGDNVFNGASAFGAITPGGIATGGNQLIILITPTNPGTGSVANLTYTYTNQGTLGSVHDASANAAVSSGAVTVADAANPIFISSTSTDLDSDGTVDQTTLVYSETVSIADGNGADGFPGVSFSDTCVAANTDYASVGTTTSVVSLTGCTASDTSILVDPTYNNASGQIQDLTALEMPTGTRIVGIDGAKPVALSAEYYDDTFLAPGVMDGSISEVDVLWSEVIFQNQAEAGDYVFNAGSDFGVVTPTGTALSGAYLGILITPTNPLSGSTIPLTFTYTDQGTLGSINDGNGNASDTSIAPVSVTDLASPIIASINLTNATTITVTFSEQVMSTGVSSTSNWTLSGGTGTPAITAVQDIAAGSSTQTITISGYAGGQLQLLYTTAGSADITDTSTALNALTTTVAANVVDTIVPTIASINLTNATTITVTFSEQVKSTGVSSTSNWTLSGGAGTPAITAVQDIAAGSSTQTITISGYAGGQLQLLYTTAGSADITDTSTALNALATTVAANVVDAILPTVITYSPADEATGIAITSNLVLTFSEPVVVGVGAGNIVIKRLSNDAILETIPGSDPRVVFSGSTVTINPTANLLNSVAYYVEIAATVVDDSVGNSYAGIAGNSTWNFTAVAAPSGGGGGGSSYNPGPTNGSVSINSGAAETLSTSVTLIIGAFNATQMIVSDRADLFGSSWETMSTTKSWTLSAGFGTKTVYVNFKDNVGNIGIVVSDTINYVQAASTPTSTQPVVTPVTPPTTSTSTTTTGLVLQDPTPAAPLPVGLNIGTLVKLAGLPAVYFIDNDNRRHAFPNLPTFYSWFPDFNDVQTISTTLMAQVPLGSNVTMRPITFFVKITTDSKVYAVESYGVLRWIPNESIAIALFGANWASRVVDVSDAFFSNYQVGSALTGTSHPTGALIQYQGEVSVYFIDNGMKSYVSSNAFVGNRFRNQFKSTNISTSIAYGSVADMTIIPLETLMKLR